MPATWVGRADETAAGARCYGRVLHLVYAPSLYPWVTACGATLDPRRHGYENEADMPAGTPRCARCARAERATKE